MITSITFTPFAFGQELEKSTWLESASIVYDQKFSKSIQSSITFETMNNDEMQFSDEFLAKLISYDEIRFVYFTTMEECIVHMDVDNQCILLGMNFDILKGDLGVTAIQQNGKKIANEFITDINNEFGTDAKFHSIFIHMDDGNTDSIGTNLGTIRTVSAVFTLPREDNSSVFTKLSERLINDQLRESGGFFNVAKELSKNPDSIIIAGIDVNDSTPMMSFKVLHQDRGTLGFVENADGDAMVEYEYTVFGFDISTINPLTSLGVNTIERSKHFEGHFVPLNSVIQVIIFPESPSQINAMNTNIIKKLDSVEDVSENGWFFTSVSHNSIDARYLFGQTNSVSANELIMEIGPADMQNGNDSFSIENINTEIQTVTVEQYAILAAIVIAAIGAAVFYLKGYKRNR